MHKYLIVGSGGGGGAGGRGRRRGGLFERVRRGAAAVARRLGFGRRR